MTIYYVRPFLGDDSNSGLSWGSAWQSLRGLRVSSVVPVAGDEIRFEKSEAYTLPSNNYSDAGYGSILEWSEPGSSGNQTRMYTGEYGEDLGSLRTYSSSPSYSRLSIARGTPVSGAATADRSWGGATVLGGYSLTGAMNATDTLLFGTTISLPGARLSGKSRLSGQIRCPTPYIGTGDADLPPNTLAIVLRNGTTVVQSITIDVPVRNSSDDWTSFEIDFTALSSTNVTNVWLSRTSSVIARDNSPFGLELAALVLSSSSVMKASDTAFIFARTATTSSIGYDEIGSNDMRVVAEQIDYWDTYNVNSGVVLSVSSDSSNDRVDPEIVDQLKIAPTPLTWVGSGGLSPVGSRGVYDLNGSVGGTPTNPVKLTGGWDVPTNTVTGITGFSGGLTAQFGSTHALLDLNGTDYVRVENMSAHYGFSSFFSRAKHVYLYKCGLPFSISPAFGAPSTDTHVTLESMYICPFVMDGWGVIGDLTLIDVYAFSPGTPATDRRSECANLTMTNSHIGTDNQAVYFDKHHYVSGNAVFDGCMLRGGMWFSSTKFGNSLVFKNHKPFPSTRNAFLILTDDDSKWDSMVYQDASMPTYNLSNSNINGVYYSKVTTDAFISVNGVAMSQLGPEYTTYETTVRGTMIKGSYTDGINNFQSTNTAFTDSATDRSYGHKYTHFACQALQYTMPANYSNLSVFGSVAMQPWLNILDESSNYAVTYDVPLTATGMVFLSNKVDEITYRTDASTYIVSNRLGYQTPLVWVTLKAIYVPRAGNYVAHFGFMKENVDIGVQVFSGIYAKLPAVGSLFTATGAYGEELGRLSVYSNHMVGPTKEVSYLKSTKEEYDSLTEANRLLNQWVDVRIEFSMQKEGLVELRHGNTSIGTTQPAIFDILEIYEQV